MAVNYKEYSRLRSIARKRIERASAAGLAAPVKVPTVAEVKASSNPEEYMAAVKAFLNQPTQVKQIRKQNIAYPEMPFPEVPATSKTKMSAEEKRARRNEQKRRSKAKRAIEKAAGSEKEARKKVGYLKALEKVAANWRAAGVDVGYWLGTLSPKKAKAFTDYIEYRFSQGDFNSQYVIDTFIRDFGALMQRGYNAEDIKSDFDSFLGKYKQLKANKEQTTEYGITQKEIWNLWNKFAYGKGLR